MDKKPANKKSVWNSILKILLIVISSLATSQIATTEPVIDLAVKTAIVQTSNMLLTVLSSDSQDTAIMVTEKAQAVEIEPQTIK